MGYQARTIIQYRRTRCIHRYNSGDAKVPFAIPLPNPSESDSAEQRPSRWLRFWSIVSAALSTAIYVWIYITGLQFENLYRGVGGDLPWLTSTVLAIYKLNGLLLLVGLAPCVMLFNERSASAKKRIRLVKFMLFGFGLAWTSLTVFTIAIYLPVFEMGATVQ